MKKVIKTMIIVSIILVIILLVVLLKSKNKELPFEREIIIVNKKELSIVKNRSDFYTVDSCVSTYINALNSKNEESLISILDKNYVKNNSITKENVIDKIDISEKRLEFFIEKMDYEITNSIGTFYVYGATREEAGMDEMSNSETEKEFNIIVMLDYINMTFSVIPTTQIENGTIQVDSIKENEYNKVYSIVVPDEQMAQKYFYNFKRMALESDEIDKIEKIYNNLDNEYKDTKFSNIEEFEEYIQKSKSKLLYASLVKWKINAYENYNQYICQDNLGNYYIFNETAPMQYTLILDTYTIELDQVIEKYDSANIQERVVLNIDKIKQALNTYDYSYVYSKLSEEFKNNKFKTLEEFESYMSNKLYDNIDIEYKKFSNEGETYIYDIIIKDSIQKENSEVIEMQIIMQLKENRDFIMSFNIKE